MPLAIWLVYFIKIKIVAKTLLKLQIPRNNLNGSQAFHNNLNAIEFDAMCCKVYHLIFAWPQSYKALAYMSVEYNPKHPRMPFANAQSWAFHPGSVSTVLPALWALLQFLPMQRHCHWLKSSRESSTFVSSLLYILSTNFKFKNTVSWPVSVLGKRFEVHSSPSEHQHVDVEALEVATSIDWWRLFLCALLHSSEELAPV